MISMMLWTALSLSAATAHGAVVPRQAGDFDLAGVILQSSQVQRHLTSTKRFMGKEFPYSEGPMEASKDVLGPKFRDEIEIFQDDMPAFLNELQQSKSEGFVANTIDDKAQPVRREGWGYPPGRNFEHCLDQSIKQNGKP
ncbi:hypothetical protein MAJ_07910, partial [Metarhizium majus ARSEF 297]